MPQPEEVAPRKPGETDAEYAFRLAKVRESMNTPEFRRAIRDVGYQNKEADDEAYLKQQKQRYEEIRGHVSLDSDEIAKVDDEAGRLAREDLASGRIKASQLGHTIIDHAKRLTERAKDGKANTILINEEIRQTVKNGQSRDPQE